MTSGEIREAFLNFFKEKGHTILPSSSLIPQGDPTLLLTTAGMVQIKPYYLGLATPPNPRLASCQKCFRATDIESVGDATHLTFFEMLGNFSVGDYFKKEAIHWAWEFVTQRLKLDANQLWITVFLDDDEAYNYWRELGVPAKRIVRLGEKDNFWGPAGDSGPCGPCSEIHYDFGEEFGCGKPDCGPSCKCKRFSEIWNLVFTQFNQDKDGKRTLLPKPNIDTGMGLERVATLMQEKTSVYHTDLFAPIVDKVSQLAGKQYGQDKAVDRAISIIAEHSRSVTFLIADGVTPGNEGRGYVLRRLLRRASLFGWKLGIEERFLHIVAEEVIERMKDVYPSELSGKGNLQRILNVVSGEEIRFHNTLDIGLSNLEGIFQRTEDAGRKVIPGEAVFQLHDTYGFPRELTEEIAAERGFSVDLDGFEKEMECQRERARSAHRFNTGDQADLYVYEQLGISRVNFLGYDSDHLRHSSAIVGLLVKGKPVDFAREGDEVEVILEETPFYGEMGGQSGDSGEIRSAQGKVDVSQAIRPLPDIIVHRAKVSEGQIAVKDRVEAEVNKSSRLDIARNHTATHLLQAALRVVLGEQVRQAGSMVTADKLRFDFTYSGSIAKEQLNKINHIVNEKIRHNLPVSGKTMDYSKAVARGAMALFGEKYGDEVRVIEVGEPCFSMELCGGTHLKSTGEIGYFYIINESSIGSGLRRIEAVTGREAERIINQRLSTLEALAKGLDTSADEVQNKLSFTLAELDRERKRSLSLERELAKNNADSLQPQKEPVSGIQVIRAQLPSISPETMREMGDRLKPKLTSGVIVLGTNYESKPAFMVTATPDLVSRGFHSGEMIKYVARIAGGGGGGRPELGQGSGKDQGKLDEALNHVPELIGDHYDKASGTWSWKKKG